MNSEEIRECLRQKGIKPTVNRILVMKELSLASCPLSLTDLEIAIDTLDKASIFRVLELFSEKDIVHSIEDGSRSLKYELCHNPNSHSISDQHVHFFCRRCHKTFCFEDVKIPLVNIPEGFSPHSVNYMIKGECPKCKR